MTGDMFRSQSHPHPRGWTQVPPNLGVSLAYAYFTYAHTVWGRKTKFYVVTHVEGRVFRGHCLCTKCVARFISDSRVSCFRLVKSRFRIKANLAIAIEIGWNLNATLFCAVDVLFFTSSTYTWFLIFHNVPSFTTFWFSRWESTAFHWGSSGHAAL